MEDDSAKKAIVPVAFREFPLKYTPDHHLVCAIPVPAQPPKWLCSNDHRRLTPRRRARDSLPSFSVSRVLCALCVEGSLKFRHSNKSAKPFNTKRAQRTRRKAESHGETYSPGGQTLGCVIFAGHRRNAHRWRKNWFWLAYFPEIVVIGPDEQVVWLSETGTLKVQFDPNRCPFQSNVFQAPPGRQLQSGPPARYKPRLLQVSPLAERPAHRQWRSHFAGKVRLVPGRADAPAVDRIRQPAANRRQQHGGNGLFGRKGDIGRPAREFEPAVEAQPGLLTSSSENFGSSEYSTPQNHRRSSFCCRNCRVCSSFLMARSNVDARK